jgi:hypothetical protein
METKFPPSPPTPKLLHKIATKFCNITSHKIFEDSGCAVCGKLTPQTQLVCRDIADMDFDILKRQGGGITHKERKSSSDPIVELDGPIIDDRFKSICKPCISSLQKGRTPLLALANDLWIGNVPEELQGLTYAEKLLIARVRHNRCVIRVTGGMHKMKANAITFANPTPKVYNVLPPPLE